jgi:glycosyltransferase involved in cell wall biosynthesis
MKILRVISSGVEEGGAEKGVVAIQPILEADGHTVKILASDSRPDKEHFNDYSFRAPGKGLVGRLMNTCNLSAYFTLRKVLREYQPDIVHLHTLGAASPAILFALRGHKTVATVHGPEGYTRDLLLWCLPKTDFKNGEYDFAQLTATGQLRYWYYRYINYPLYRLGFRNIDQFVTISTYITKVMEAQGVTSTYIPNGVSMLPFTPTASQKIDHSLLFAGRLEKFKGVEYLLYALGAILALFPETILYVAGEGREMAELISLAKELGIEKSVIFLGHLNSTRLAELYSKVTLALVPSVWPEVCSRAGIEAMSAGRPVIGSNVGGSSDWLIDHKNGRLVPPKDSKAISDAVIDLFSNPAKLVEMSVAAREKALEYDVALHAIRIEKVYANLLADSREKTGAMRIFYITDQQMDTASAASVHVDEVCKSMLAIGNELTLYAPKINGRVAVSNCPTVFLSVPGRLSSLVYQPKLLFRLIRDMYTYRPDVLYVRRSQLLFVPALVGKLFGVPVVFEINGLVEQDAQYINPTLISNFLLRTKIFSFIEWMNIKLAAHNIVVAEGIKQFLMQVYQVPESKITLVQNGVDTEVFTTRDRTEVRKSLHLPEALTIGYVGSMHTWQGLRHVVEAMHIVGKERDAVRFCVAGKGEDYSCIESFIEKHGLENKIALVSETAYKTLALYKSALDIGICYPLKIRAGLTSPMKVYEYLASGSAVVLGNITGMEEEFKDIVQLVEPENAEALAAALITLIDDTEKRDALSKSGRKFIENGHTWEVVANTITGILRSAISNRA